MTGRQLNIQAYGSTNEAFCEAMLGRIASMIPVPREQDFGIDFYCLPRKPIGAHSETTVELAGVQVKSDSASRLSFGGIRPSTTEWRRHELEWLRVLRIPLYLATVDGAYERVNLYSVSRCLQVFLKSPVYPFAIECTLSPLDLAQPSVTAEPQPVPGIPATSEHDGATWRVDLGRPFLTLTFSDLDRAAQREWVTRVFLQWIAADVHTIGNLSLGVPVVRMVQQYFTNVTPTEIQNIMFWYPNHPLRARNMAAQLAPGIASVARQLLSEGRLVEAKQWLAALQWCKAQSAIEGFGQQAIADLEKLP